MSRGWRRLTSRKFGPHRTLATKSLSHASATTHLSPTPAKPFEEVIHQYTNTWCTTQKQTNLTNSLLQDINVFNKYDLTKLEEWLMDIEMAVDYH